MKIGSRSVVAADALQPAQDVRQVAAEHAAVGVQLVDHDEPQVLEQLRPARMMRQDPRVQHVGIAEHHVRLAPDRAPRVRRRVAVVGEHADLQLAVARHQLGEHVKLGQLVLRQRLGRKEIQRPRRRILQDRVEDRGVVAERFPGSRRRNRDDVAPREHVLERFRLMRVELLDAARPPAPPSSRGSVPSGYGANDASIAGIRWAAVTIGSASAPRGARDAVSRFRTSWRERSLSVETTGSVDVGSISGTEARNH